MVAAGYDEEAKADYYTIKNRCVKKVSWNLPTLLLNTVFYVLE